LKFDSRSPMTTTAETGQSSGSKPSDDDAWAKLGQSCFLVVLTHFSN